MEDKNKVTVIVPVYNAEVYLQKCIESILCQTYADLQIILVDDGSADASGGICDGYAERDKRIQVFHTENKGLVAARKLGISHATGSYIGFVDADDYIERDMYEYLLKNIADSHADFVHTGGYIVENGGRSKEVYDGCEESTYDLKNVQERMDFLRRHVLNTKDGWSMTLSVWSKLFKRELIEKSYFPLPDEQQFGEDQLCMLLSILQSERIVLKKRAFYHYVTGKPSLSTLSKVDFALQETALAYHFIKVIRDFNLQCYMELKGDIRCYLENRALFVINLLNDNETICLMPYYFSGIESLRGKKIAIYGAGAVGQSYYSQFRKYGDIEIVAWFDSNRENCRFDYADILDGTRRVAEYEFDKIIVAVQKETVAVQIADMLKSGGVSDEKIVWREPEKKVMRQMVGHSHN